MALTLRTGGGLLSPASAVNSNKNTSKNNGGLIGGVGYLAEKSALGFLSSVEGIWDYSAGGVAKLFGVDKWAERQFANDLVNYTHADEWYDPGKGWQIAGDVAGGIGTSMPAIAGAALITYFSGGTAAPAAAKLLSASVAPLIAGFGAAGSATKEAYQKTGNLGAKEFGYGALSGATEAAIEGVTARIGTGTGRIVSALSKKAAGETVQTLSKSGAKSVIKHLAADFASEAVEEGLAEAIDPLYQKLTIDPKAKAATAQEIGYAALVGGLSGLVMSGGAATVNTIANLSSGNAAINSGNAEKIIKTASNISAYEDANDTGYESYKAISADYKALSESLKQTGGQITTAKQRMLLGSLKKAETAAFVEPFIERSAENLLLHADIWAERFSAFGMTDADGKEIHVTADEIRSGVDADLIRKANSGKLTKAEQKTFTKQVRAAMRSNSVLTTLATMDATGRITMNARKFAEAAREGADIATAADINAFAEIASQEEIRDLAADLGIADWAALTPDEFREKTAAFAQSDRGRELSYQNKRIRAAMGIAEDSAVELPNAFRGDIAEGATRYRTADGIDMAIIREGDRNYIYNYASGDISRAMSEADVNKILADYWSGNKKAADDARLALSQSEVQNNVQNNVGSVQNNADLLGVAATARYNMLAAENIKGWRQLSEPVKQAVRMTMRQAEAAGLSEDTAITFGRVAAHSGMNIVFDSIRSGAGDALQTGNTIYIDPGADKSRVEKRLLIHEMAHALIKRQGGWQLLTDAFFATDPAREKEIEDRYIAHYKKQGLSEAQYMPIVSEEIAVAHLEDVLGRDGVWDYMLADEPSLGEKVLNFFRGSARDYADDAGLSAESRKLLTMYRKMFRELSEKRRGGNALELAEQAKMAGDSERKRFAFSENFGKQLHDWQEGRGKANGSYNGKFFRLGTTPKVLIKHGAPAGEVIMYEDCLLKITGLKHTIALDELAKIPLQLNDPILLFRGSVNNSFVALTEIKAKNGHDVVVAVHINKQLGRSVINKIASVYSKTGKTGANNIAHYVTEQITHGNLLDASAKKAPIWFTASGLQLPHAVQTIIDANSSNDQVLKPESKDSGNLTPEAVLDNPATNDRIAQTKPKVNRNDKISSRDRLALPEDKALDALLDEKIKVQNRLAELRKLKKDIESSQEYNDIVSKIVNSEKSAMDDLIQEYNEWAKRSKYNEIVEEIKSLDDSESKLIRQYRELQEQKAVFDEQKNIETTGLSENEYFRKQAVKEFGYTPYFYDAGYMLQNGKLLNFSGEKGRHFGSRGEDHRAIGQIFANLNGGKALVKFMSYGNIRVMAETPGIDIFATEEPTSEQYSGIRKFVREYAKEGYFAVDITDENGRVIGTYSYENNINAERVVNDIKYYYQHGELREQSSIANFRYALPEEGSEGVKGRSTEVTATEAIEVVSTEETKKKSKKKKAKKSGYYMSPGQLRADVAKKIHKKAYSKKDAAEALNQLTGAGLLSKDTQKKLIDHLWQGFNTCETDADRRKFAESFSLAFGDALFMIEEDSPFDKLRGNEREALVRGFEKTILQAFDEKGNFSVFSTRVERLLEAYTTQVYKAQGMAELSREKFEEGLREVKLEKQKYRDKTNQARQAYKEIAKEDKAYYQAKEKKAREKFEEEIARQKNIANQAKEETRRIRGEDKLLAIIDYHAMDLRDIKLGTFKWATQEESHLFRGSLETLANIEYRRRLDPKSVSKVKKALNKIKKFYRKDNKVLLYESDEHPGYYSEKIAEKLDNLTGDGNSYDKYQLSDLGDVMAFFKLMVKFYGKIWLRGEYVDVKPLAEKYVNKIVENEKLGDGLLDKATKGWYVQKMGDPQSIIKNVDRYDPDSFFTGMFDDTRHAEVDASSKQIEVMNQYDQWMRGHKSFLKDIRSQEVVWKDRSDKSKEYRMPKSVAIGLYMMSQRSHSHIGLLYNGWRYADIDKNFRRVDPLLTKGEMKTDDSEQLSETEQKVLRQLQESLREQFNQTDMEYIGLLEKVYNDDLRTLKMERDMERQGYSNVVSGYYYPIRRADTAKSVDVSDFGDLDRITKSSFNRYTIKNAITKLQIDDVDEVFQNQVRSVIKYAYLSPVIENYDVLYHYDISGNPGNPVSVSTVSENYWKDNFVYFRDLIMDIQGKRNQPSFFSKVLSKARSGYAMYQLGANPKTVVTQLSSLFASSSILDPTAIMSGLKYGGKDVDQYCKLAELRHYDAAAVKAQGVLDRIGTAGELLMKPIGGMDRLVVKTLWGACQVQVSKDQKLKIGTEENKVAAGKLLEKVLFETQQNSLATERSAAMRSGSEFAKAITMFSADGMKVTGRVLDGFGEVSVLKRRIKVAGDDEKEALQKQLKAAMKKARRAVAALIGSAAFSVAIAEAFRWLYNKKREEDENVALDLTGELIGNMMGGLPLFRDLYDRIVNGYEMDNFTVSMLNDLFGTFDSAIDLSVKIIKGESDSTDIASWIKQTSYTAGQFTGIPVRNIYNLLTGLTRRFSPVAGYQIDRVFYSKNYRNDLREAVEAGDTRMVAMLTGIIHGKDASGEIGDEGMTELNRLAMAGANVMPRTIGKKITVDGEEVELDQEQQSAITEAYEDAWSAGLAELMKSDSYSKMTDEQREDAIRKVHDISYERALLDGGFDRGERSVTLASAVGLSKAAVYYATVSGMAADVDRKGNKIEGSRRTKTVAAIEAMTNVREERLLLLTAAGYSLQAGDFRFATAEDAKRRLLRYIVNMKGVSAEEKAAIAQMCGFEVKNGKISAKSLIA